jgi:hypothetical protein
MLLILIGVVFLPLIVAVILRIRWLRHMGGSIEKQNAQKWPPALRKMFRAIVHSTVLAGIFLIWLVPDNQYDWMCSEEEWEGTPPTPCIVPDDPSGGNVLFAGVLLAIVVAVQLILAARANNEKEMALPAIFIFLAICAWGLA